MDDEDKHNVRLETRSQVSESAWEYSESTDSDIKQDNMYATVTGDCDVSTNIPTQCMDDYNMLKSMKHAHGWPDGRQTYTDYNQQGDMVKCLPSVKCEGHSQELNEQSHVIPSRCTDDETSLTCDVKMKKGDKEDTGGYDRRNDATRHWIVCHGGVLKEVKAEHTSDVSEILSVERCSDNVGCELGTHTCTQHNDIHDEDINVKLCTDSTCGLSLSQVRPHDNVLKVHKQSCTGGKHRMCDTRGKEYADLSQHNVHERTHTGVKPFTCDTCGKSFAYSGNLNVHKRTHTGVKPFTCNTCGKSFALSKTLRGHERTHACVNNFICDTCGKLFARSSTLRVHERTHTGVKLFTCDTCGKSFADSGNLNVHKRTHTGVKPFTCDACGKSFAHSKTLKGHERTHAGVKPFTCDTCGKSFTDSGNLNVHKMIHTGVKPFTCDTCGKSFAHSG